MIKNCYNSLRKRLILISVALCIVLTAAIFYLIPASHNKKVAIILGSQGPEAPCLYRDFPPSFQYADDAVPITFTMKDNIANINRLPFDKTGSHIDKSRSFKGGSSMKIMERNKGISFVVKNFDSADVTVSFYARCDDNKIGYVKVCFISFDSETNNIISVTHGNRAINDRWQSVTASTPFNEKVKDLAIVIINMRTNNCLWVDSLSVRKRPLTSKEMVNEQTIAALDILGINYEIIESNDIKNHNLNEYDGLIVPYYEPQLKDYCAGNYYKNLPVYVLYYEPGIKDMPYAGIKKSGEKDEYANLSTGAQNFPYRGMLQTLDVSDSNLKPLLWQSGEPQRALSWKYKNVMWNSFVFDDIKYIYIFGQMVQDLNLIVSPFVFALDIDDLNVPIVPAENIQRVAQLLREKNWSTYLGIVPENLNYLEPESISKAENDSELKKGLELEKRQVETILNNRDVFNAIPHYHKEADRWLSPIEEEQAENYLGKLEKMRRYGFRGRQDSFGYRYFPNNWFNDTTINYLTRLGVHIFRVCIDTGGRFENRFYQVGNLNLIPSGCPINAALQTIYQTSDEPLTYYCKIMRAFSFSLLSQYSIFIHAYNFADDTVGFKAMPYFFAYSEASKIVIYGKPFDLRDKYVYPVRILTQKERKDKILLTFDRELIGQKLMSPNYPVKQVKNERGEYIILYSPNVFTGVGKELTLYTGSVIDEQVPALSKISSNAHLRYATYKNKKITIELEGYADTEITLTNLPKSTSYLITNNCTNLPGQEKTTDSFTQNTSAEGEMTIHIPLFSYNSVLIAPAK